MNVVLIVLGILFIIPCVLFFIFPTFVLTFGSKWQYKDAEPSESAYAVGRIVSIVGLLIGLCLLLYGIFEAQILEFFNARDTIIIDLSGPN